MTTAESVRVNPENVPIHGITFREAVLVWAKGAALSFGGPAGQIAVMRRIVVEGRAGAERFSRSRNLGHSPRMRGRASVTYRARRGDRFVADAIAHTEFEGHGVAVTKRCLGGPKE